MKAMPLSATVRDVFKEEEKILDIGCGSGRELRMLLDAGYDARGLEAAKEFIRLAEENDPELKGRIYHGSIPDKLPAALKTVNWDGIICSAVLQHIPDALILDCFRLFQRLLNPSGRLLISIPTEYPVQDDQDARGRLFKVRPLEAYDRLLQKTGFTLLRKELNSDGLNREGIEWAQLVCRKQLFPKSRIIV